MMRTRMLSKVGHRSFDFQALSKKLTDPKAKAALDTLRNKFAEVDHEATVYFKEPVPIDWAGYRSKIKSSGLVDALEAEFNKIQYPKVDPSEFLNAGVEDYEALLSQAKTQIEDSTARIEELKETISLMEQTRTTRDTTIAELDILHPEIANEIDDEIANYEWNKDV